MRVVAGEYGGRRLKSLAGRTTRPTADKVKGAIFNMIGPYFENGRVLDLYAGSGALAIEAVSRGCTEAVLVDKDRGAQAVIAENIALTKESEKFQLLKLSAKQALEQLGGSFNLIFLDPPYAKEQIEADLLELQERQLLATGAIAVCETDQAVELPQTIGQLALDKEKVYGITKISIYRKDS